MKQIFILFISLSGILCSFAQKIELSFPALAEKKAEFTWFKGAQTDTLSLLLDSNGFGIMSLPENYLGIVRLAIPNSGIFEFIGGEPGLMLETAETHLSKNNIKIKNSVENDFLFRAVEEKSINMNKKGWIQAGMQMYDASSNIYRLLLDESEKNDKETDKINKEISDTHLFAGRFIESIEFINNMGIVLDNPAPADINEIKDFFHNKIDWQALYHAGNFWKIIINYYANLFDKENLNLDKKTKGNKFAEDICPLFDKMNEPIRSAFFKSIYSECERLGWEEAKTDIVSYIAEKNIKIQAPGEYIKLLLAGYQTREGNKAPVIEGLTTAKHSGTTLLIFFEVGCSNCEREMQTIKANYARLAKRNIRIVSISANTDKAEYEPYSISLPWKDKLCDYKGFDGNNFINYGIMGVPTFFIIDEDGIIKGRYAEIADAGLLQ